MLSTMRKYVILGLVGLLTLAGCKNVKTTDMSNSNPLQEVAGRKNFGPNHALAS